MKYLMFSIILCCAFMSTKAQIIRPVLSAGNHITLDSVIVSYQSIASAAGNSTAIFVKAELNLKLKSGAIPDSVFVQVLHPQSLLPLYTVSYSLSAAPVISQGKTLFRMEGNKLYIACTPELSLRSYTYHIYTGNAQGVHSPVFSTRQ